MSMNVSRRGTWKRTFAEATLVVAAVACTSGTDVEDPGAAILAEVVFLTQSEVPDAVMEALYEGDVELDEQGCLRLEAEPDGHTVIWPHGFRILPTIEGLEVQDAGGRTVGWVGGPFRLGGGEVTELHEGIPLTAADRERALTLCPGRYWIVGEL